MSGDPPADRRGKPLRRPTPARLRNRALAYLERFPTARAHLRRVLLRRAAPEAQAHEVALDALEADVDALLNDLERLGLLDDRRFAEAKARTLLERGRAPGRVRQTLRAKGVGTDTAAAALDSVEEREGLNEWQAIVAYARRRRLGPFRRGEPSPETLTRELAALGRAGFAYGPARRLVEATDVEELKG